MEKTFEIKFGRTAGLVASVEYYTETEQEAIEFFRKDFGGAPVIEYCEEIAVDEML